MEKSYKLLALQEKIQTTKQSFIDNGLVSVGGKK